MLRPLSLGKCKAKLHEDPMLSGKCKPKPHEDPILFGKSKQAEITSVEKKKKTLKPSCSENEHITNL